MMSIFGSAPAEQNLSQHQILESKYKSARSNLLLVVVFTAINIVLLLANGNTYFLFSAFVPYILVDLGMMMCGKYPIEEYGSEFVGVEFLDNSFLVVMVVVAAVFLLLYLASWFFSKDYKLGWIIFALVFFGLDTVGMLLLVGISADNIIDIVFHGWVIFSLINAIISYNKLKKLPEEESEVLPVTPEPQNASPEF